MSENDILEMDSNTETEEMDGDVELATINADVGEKSGFILQKMSVVLGVRVKMNLDQET